MGASKNDRQNKKAKTEDALIYKFYTRQSGHPLVFLISSLRQSASDIKQWQDDHKAGGEYAYEASPDGKSTAGLVNIWTWFLDNSSLLLPEYEPES